MKDSSEIVFKTIQASWGIHIIMSANASRAFDDINIDIEVICPAFFIRFDSKVLLSKEEKSQVINGMRSVLLKCKSQDDVLITVNKIVFNYTDYQQDGLFWAARSLAADIVEIYVDEPLIEYIRSENKYVFSLEDKI